MSADGPTPSGSQYDLNMIAAAANHWRPSTADHVDEKSSATEWATVSSKQHGLAGAEDNKFSPLQNIPRAGFKKRVEQGSNSDSATRVPKQRRISPSKSTSDIERPAGGYLSNTLGKYRAGMRNRFLNRLELDLPSHLISASATLRASTSRLPPYGLQISKADKSLGPTLHFINHFERCSRGLISPFFPIVCSNAYLGDQLHTLHTFVEQQRHVQTNSAMVGVSRESQDWHRQNLSRIYESLQFLQERWDDVDARTELQETWWTHQERQSMIEQRTLRPNELGWPFAPDGTFMCDDDTCAFCRQVFRCKIDRIRLFYEQHQFENSGHAFCGYPIGVKSGDGPGVQRIVSITYKYGEPAYFIEPVTTTGHVIEDQHSEYLDIGQIIPRAEFLHFGLNAREQRPIHAFFRLMQMIPEELYDFDKFRVHFKKPDIGDLPRVLPLIYAEIDDQGLYPLVNATIPGGYQRADDGRLYRSTIRLRGNLSIVDNQ